MRPDVPLTWTTDHLDIYVSEGLRVCAGMASEYERHVLFVADQLAVEPRTHIPLYLLSSWPDACAGNPACTTPDGTVFSRPRSTYHELAHGVACQLSTASLPALVEGLAVMFQSEPLSARYPEQSAAALLSEPYPFAADQYENAGHFTRWLYEREDAATFVAAFAALERNEFDIIEQVLVDLYAAELDALDAAYAETAPHTWAPFRQCADVPYLDPNPDGTWTWSRTMDCDRDDTLGPYERRDPIVASASALMYQSFTFTVEDSQDLIVEFVGAKQVEFERCAEQHAVSEDIVGAVFDWDVALWDAGSEVRLTPGLWRADVLAFNSAPVAVDVVIRSP